MANEVKKELNIFNVPKEQFDEEAKELWKYLYRVEEKDQISQQVSKLVQGYLKDFLVIGHPVDEKDHLSIIPMHQFENGRAGRGAMVATITWDLEEEEMMGMDFVKIEKIHVNFCEEGANHPKTRLKLLF